MSRLIDADKLPHYDGTALSAVAVARAVENAPTIDAVPVVRCKDCRWRTGLEEHTAWHPCDEMAVNDNWFCADGEREDDVSDTNVGKTEEER